MHTGLRCISGRALITLLSFTFSANVLRADDGAFFEKQIRPVLAGTCFKCHGNEKTGGKLRVDSREALLKGGQSGPALVPGEPDTSLVLRALNHTKNVSAMPPDKKLPEAVIADFALDQRRGNLAGQRTVARLRSRPALGL